MKSTEIDECVQAYRDGLVAYSELEKNIRAAQSATAEVPLRIPSVREARERLAEAHPILSRLGEALAFLPALAIQLKEERRISGTLRRHGKRNGVKHRYDKTGVEADSEGEDTD